MTQATLGIWLALHPEATPFERQVQGILSMSHHRYPWWHYERDKYTKGPVILNELAFKTMMVWSDKLNGRDEHNERYYRLVLEDDPTVS